MRRLKWEIKQKKLNTIESFDSLSSSVKKAFIFLDENLGIRKMANWLSSGLLYAQYEDLYVKQLEKFFFCLKLSNKAFNRSDKNYNTLKYLWEALEFFFSKKKDFALGCLNREPSWKLKFLISSNLQEQVFVLETNITKKRIGFA